MAKRGHIFGFGSALSTNGSRHALLNPNPPARLVVEGVHLANALDEGERGALIFPDVQVSGGATSFEMQGGAEFDPDALRSTLLLFDRLDYPRNTMMGVGPETPLGLEQWPGIQRSAVVMSGMFGSGLFQTALLAAFEAHNAREEGKWSVARAASSVSLPPSAFSDQAGFKLKLENLLPVPDRQVPYEDVLQFREEHRSELLALRHYLDELGLQVARDGFGGLAESVALESFMRSLDDYHAAMRPKNFLKRITSLEVSFSLNEAVKAGFGAIALAAQAPSATLAEYLATVGGVIAVDKALSLKRDCPVPQAYEYLFKAGKEL